MNQSLSFSEFIYLVRILSFKVVTCSNHKFLVGEIVSITYVFLNSWNILHTNMLSFHLHINMFSFHFHWLFDRRSTFDILTLKSNFNFILHHLFVTLDFSIPLKIFSHPLLTACSHMTSARRRRGETVTFWFPLHFW